MNNRIASCGVVVIAGLMAVAPLSRAGLSGTDIPLDGSRIRLIDSPGAQGRRNLVGFVGPDVTLAMVDPTVTGATATIGQVGVGAVTVLGLPASNWSRTGNTPRIDFKFKSRTGPVRSARLIDGRLVRFSATGTEAYGLGGTPQGAVGVIVEVGPVRFCGLFGGTIRMDDGRTFLARTAPAPPACPVLGTGAPTTTTAPTTTSTTTTTESTSTTTTTESTTTTTESTSTTTTTESTTTTTTTPLPPCEGDPDFPETGARYPACGGTCPDPNAVCQAYTYELTLGRTGRGCACVPTGSVCGPSDLPPTPGCSNACTLGFSLTPTIGACPSGSACMVDEGLEGLSICTNLYDPSDGTCAPIPDPGFFFRKYRCRVPETACGNGIVETPFVGTPEQCDDGNAVEGDGCSTTCQFNFCGNGTIEPGEQCDDGNVTSGDGCSFLCELDEFEGCNVTGTWSGTIFGVYDWTLIEAPNGAVTGVTWQRAAPDLVYPTTGSRSGSGLQLVGLGGLSLNGTLTTCDAMTILTDVFPIEITRVRNDYCGDGALAPAYEACDDGNLAPGDGCSPSCATNG